MFDEALAPLLIVSCATALAAFYALHEIAGVLTKWRKQRAGYARQRVFLVERFGAAVADRILRGEVWEGATLEMMSESLGKPRAANHSAGTPLGDSRFEFRGARDVRAVEVRFQRGVVVSWRELE